MKLIEPASSQTQLGMQPLLYICDEVKNNTHYLLTCPNYSHMCDEMVTSIGQITKLISEHDQEIPQSQTVDKPMAPRGRAT